MAPTLFTSPRPLRRAGATGVACLALAGLGAGSAAAAGAPVVPLTPSALALALLPTESLPDDAGALQDMTGVDALDPTQFVAVGSAYGGTLTVHLPAPLDGAHLVATLDVPATGAAPDPAKDAVATSSGAGATIRITPAGTDTYTITLPSSAELGTTHGDDGYLELSGITTPLGASAAGFVVLPYRLGLGAGDASTELDPVLFAAGQVPGTSVAAGASLQVTLPAGSDLQDLGVSTLAPGAFVLQGVGPDGQPTDAPPVVLDATVSPDGRTATLAVPAGTPAGTYVLAVVLPDGSETTITITVAALTVTAVQAVPAVAPLPAAPATAAPAPATAAPVKAAPVVHRGLRSNTDWADHAAAPATAARPTRPGHATGGTAALLVAALGGVAVRAVRRRALRG